MGKIWKYLYRAVDSHGDTIEFMVSPERDKQAAKRFFRKTLAATHAPDPRTITVDKNPAFPKAITELKKEGTLAKDCKLRRIKYLNNIVEQDHRFIKRLVRPGLGFFSFETAWKTLTGFEVMNMIRKGQIRGVPRGDILGQVSFISLVFGLAG